MIPAITPAIVYGIDELSGWRMKVSDPASTAIAPPKIAILRRRGLNGSRIPVI